MASWLLLENNVSLLSPASLQALLMLAYFVTILPAGAIVGIYKSQLILKINQYLLFATIFILAIAISLHIAPSKLLFVTSCVLGLSNAIYAPTWQTEVNSTVPTAMLPMAIRLNSLSFNIARAVGGSLGGFIIHWVGILTAFYLLTGLSLLAAINFYNYKVSNRLMVFKEKIPNVFASTKAGLKFAWNDDLIKIMMLTAAIFYLHACSLWALLPVMARHLLTANVAEYGVIFACIGYGTVFSAIFLLYYDVDVNNYKLISTSNIIYAFILISIGYWHNFYIICICFFAAGFVWFISASSFNVFFQLNSPKEYQARIFSIYMMVYYSMYALGAYTWGKIASQWNCRVAIVSAGVCFCLSIFLLNIYRNIHAQNSIANQVREQHLVSNEN